MFNDGSNRVGTTILVGLNLSTTPGAIVSIGLTRLDCPLLNACFGQQLC